MSKRVKKRCFFLIACLSLLVSCHSEEQSRKPEVHEVVDSLGRRLKVPVRPTRIISLAPSMTECLGEVCPEQLIVGVTQNCNFPKWSAQKAVVTTYPTLDLEKIVALQPDLVMTHAGMTQQDDMDALDRLGIPVYVARFQTVESVFTGLETLGELTGNTEKGIAVADSLRLGYQGILDEMGNGIDQTDVLVLVSTDPIYAHGANTLIDDMIKQLGGQNAAARISSKAYPQLTREMLLKLNPEIIITGENDELNELFFQKYPEAKLLNAVENGHVFVLEGDYHSRPGPRVLFTLSQIQSIVRRAKE